ncbi:MAG: gamma-glutamyltransferase, partial [Bauldia sp.]
MKATRILRLVAAFLLSAHAAVALAASAPPAKAPDGMVVTSHHLASEVGAAILREGGNAVDAAVAIGYALAVVNPCCGNIGGGGFATIRMADGTTTVIDFRETAPAAATGTMFLDAKGDVIPRSSLDRYKAVAVPGTVLGLDTMLRKYGTFSRQRAMAPAIALAAEGFVLDWRDVALLEPLTEAFAAQPNVAATFLNNGRPFEAPVIYNTWYPYGINVNEETVRREIEHSARLGAEAFVLDAGWY